MFGRLDRCLKVTLFEEHQRGDLKEELLELAGEEAHGQGGPLGPMGEEGVWLLYSFFFMRSCSRTPLAEDYIILILTSVLHVAAFGIGDQNPSK